MFIIWSIKQLFIYCRWWEMESCGLKKYQDAITLQKVPKMPEQFHKKKFLQTYSEVLWFLKKELLPHDALTAKSHARPLFSSPTATSSSDLYNISDDDSGKLCKTWFLFLSFIKIKENDQCIKTDLGNSNIIIHEKVFVN